MAGIGAFLLCGIIGSLAGGNDQQPAVGTEPTEAAQPTVTAPAVTATPLDDPAGLLDTPTEAVVSPTVAPEQPTGTAEPTATDAPTATNEPSATRRPALPTATARPAAATNLDTNGADLYNCGDFDTWEEANAVFQANLPGDPNKLDNNDDGIPCESLR
jgi:hypothetical protein